MTSKAYFKIIFYAVTFLMFGGVITTAAQTPTSDSEIICADEGLTRYEVWVRDIPCAPEAHAIAAIPQVEIGENPNDISGILPDQDDFIDLVFSSYEDGNWEILGANDPWGAYGIQYQVRITNHPASDIRPRIRPGKAQQVIFTSNRTGNYELFLTEYWNENNLKQLTFSSAYDSQAAWSPDGSKIVFVSDRDGNLELYTMQADGSQVTRLTFDSRDDFNPYWSSGSNQIIWVRAINSTQGVLYAMNPDGSDPHPISAPMRYLQDPAASRDGLLISFDYDANSDSWNDLALMNSDGSGLRTLTYGSRLIDYWAGSLPMVEGKEVIFTEVNYVVYDDRLYISSMCTSYYALASGYHDCLVFSTLDMYPDATLTDISTPETFVEPLPQFVRASGFPLMVTSYDPGPAHLYATSTQYRNGPSGIWTTISSGWEQIYYSDTTRRSRLIYQGNPGTTLYFRSQGKDWAEHLEPWPPGDGDTYSHLYAWQLHGNAIDNRETEIPNASVEIQPSFPYYVNSNQHGEFIQYAPSNLITVTVNKANYGTVPNISLLNQTDKAYFWVLPPADNLIANGNFENGLSEWSVDDNIITDPQIKHTGMLAAKLGYPKLAENKEYVYVSDSIYGSPGSPQIIADIVGNTHAFWTDIYQNEASIFYATKSITGTWTTPMIIYSGSSSCPDAALDQDSNLHVVWHESLDNGAAPFYSSQQSDGTWSEAVMLAGPNYAWSPIKNSCPVIVIDGQNVIHIVWADQDGMWYIHSTNSEDWSTPIKLAGTYSPHALAVDESNVIHLAYVNSGISYIQRATNGVWSAPITISDPVSIGDVDMAVDPGGNVHIIFNQYTNEVFYLKRNTSGQWSLPKCISGSRNVYEISLATDSQNSHVIWRGENGLEYIRQFNGESWSPAFAIQSENLPAGLSLTSINDHPQALWTDRESYNVGIIFNEWEISQIMYQTLSQPVTLSQDIYKPTLSFTYQADQQGTGSIFDVEISNSKVFSTTNISTTWTHEWVDLAPWLGQTITVTFFVENDYAQGILGVNIDDVSLGSWLTPVISEVSPSHSMDWYKNPITITITGENFIQTPTVRIGDTPTLDVQWIDENTLTAVIPGDLPIGKYDIWVTNPGGQEALLASGLQLGAIVYLPLTSR